MYYFQGLLIFFFFNYRKGGFFVDLFVRVSNQVAVNMYKQLGYSVYRTVIEYYSASNGEPDEDAYGELPFGVVSLRGSQMSTFILQTEILGYFNTLKRIIFKIWAVIKSALTCP